MDFTTGKKPKVAVIGLAGQSAFLSADHFPQPGETIGCGSLFFEPGGKGYNQAIACARMGVQTVFVGAVGDDANAEDCRRELEQEGITACLVKKEMPTAYAVITINREGENTVQVYGGAAKCLDGADLRRADVISYIRDCDYLLLQNELSRECLLESFRVAQELHIPVILNPAPADDVPVELLKNSFVITPNFGEAKHMAGLDGEEHSGLSEDDVIHQIQRFFQENGVKKAVITMGGKGAILIHESGMETAPAFSCGDAIDTTGAGDTFNGTLAAALALGKNMNEAVRFATISAGISVTRKGAAGSIPKKEELLSYL